MTATLSDVDTLEQVAMRTGLKRLKGIDLPSRDAEESIGLTCLNLLSSFKLGWGEYLNAM
jgi:hypothetical protein